MCATLYLSGYLSASGSILGFGSLPHLCHIRGRVGTLCAVTCRRSLGAGLLAMRPGLQGKGNVVVLPKPLCHLSRFNEVLSGCNARLPSRRLCYAVHKCVYTHGSQSRKLWACEVAAPFMGQVGSLSTFLYRIHG